MWRIVYTLITLSCLLNGMVLATQLQPKDDQPNFIKPRTWAAHPDKNGYYDIGGGRKLNPDYFFYTDWYKECTRDPTSWSRCPRTLKDGKKLKQAIAKEEMKEKMKEENEENEEMCVIL
jgi:hypothetical protein